MLVAKIHFFHPPPHPCPSPFPGLPLHLVPAEHLGLSGIQVELLAISTSGVEQCLHCHLCHLRPFMTAIDPM